jgi:hypothetical protein
MRLARRIAPVLLVLAAVSLLVASAGATSLVRRDLESLVRQNQQIVLGTVVDLHSYWNTERTHILTDVRVRADQVLKGQVLDDELVVTLVGGTVGDVTTLVIGGPRLEPGAGYVFFLSRGQLPGAGQVTTIPDHVQGVFDVLVQNGARRAVSQALEEPLLPDEQGKVDVPGGERGLALDDLLQRVRSLSGK